MIFPIFHCLKASLYPVQGTNSWFLIWPPEIVSIVDDSYCWCFVSLPRCFDYNGNHFFQPVCVHGSTRPQFPLQHRLLVSSDCLWWDPDNIIFDISHIILYRWVGKTWWRHQMETFSALLALCAGNSPVTREFPSQRPVTRRSLMFSLICAWING